MASASKQLSFIDDFDFLEYLGGGSYGVVYKVQPRKKKSAEKYALKITAVESKEDLEKDREGKFAEQMRIRGKFPNIIRTEAEWSETKDMNSTQQNFSAIKKSLGKTTPSFETWATEKIRNRNTAYLKCYLMELCKESLGDWMKRLRNPPVDGPTSVRLVDNQQISKIMNDIISGVNEVHRRGLIHRDLKPCNVLLGLDGNWKIADFGLVVKDPFGDHSSKSLEGISASQNWAGTRDFMAPEIYFGDRKFDRKADVFSIGLIYVFMVCGHDDLDMSEIVSAIGDVRKGNYSQFEASADSCGLGSEHISLVKLMTERVPERRISASDLAKKFSDLPSASNVSIVLEKTESTEKEIRAIFAPKSPQPAAVGSSSNLDFKAQYSSNSSAAATGAGGVKKASPNKTTLDQASNSYSSPASGGAGAAKKPSPSKKSLAQVCLVSKFNEAYQQVFKTPPIFEKDKTNRILRVHVFGKSYSDEKFPDGDKGDNEKLLKSVLQELKQFPSSTNVNSQTVDFFCKQYQIMFKKSAEFPKIDGVTTANFFGKPYAGPIPEGKNQRQHRVEQALEDLRKFKALG